MTLDDLERLLYAILHHNGW